MPSGARDRGLLEQLYFDDLTVGQTWKSPSRTITDAHFLLFAGVTGDNHPLHYDYEYTRNTIFGKPVAHGLLVMALTALGASELSPRFEAAMIAFLEQGGRFVRPVLVGDTVEPRFEVRELIPKGDRGIVVIGVRIVNQRGEVCLEGFHKYLMRRRPTGA